MISLCRPERWTFEAAALVIEREFIPEQATASGEGAKVQQQCAPSWRRSADARLSARCPGRSSRGPSLRGEPYPQSVVGPPRRGEVGLHEGAERSRSRRGH
ncbi:Oviduct-Specific Glycoprotein [Manis pentadactyla]|nr:Oviduct-Specific Glycoprotein [Manis pentadactyla]